jgi:pimeloyl-ACP methyl ester carboxylesterase
MTRSPRSALAPVLAVACQAADPLDVPQDPLAQPAPVGVQTLAVDGRTVEVWYPAPSDAPEGPGDEVPIAPFLPASFIDATPELTLPTLTTSAVRDAPLRDGGEPWPVVVFSHGFGGFRQQSVDLTTHLASRGYVVLSADHTSRWIGGLVPCLLTTTISDCALSFDPSADPAVDDVVAMLDWVASPTGAFVDHVDASRVGMFGHSAGGGTTTAIANTDPRVQAALAMAGAGPFEADIPSAVLGGSCDGVVPEAGEGGLAESGLTASAGYGSIAGAGHLAFSDLCELDLGALGAQIGERDDANGLFLDGLIQLGTDGCPGGQPADTLPACADGFLDLDVSTPLLRWTVAAFFDEHLRDAGPGLAAASFPELSWPTGPEAP